MAQIIRFDDGFQEYQVNGNGALRVNPSDPNLYQRFLDSREKLLQVEQNMTAQAQQWQDLPADATQEERMHAGEKVVRLLSDADREVKEVLAWVFPGNDFDQLLGGANTMAVARNGERVITNFLAALVPIVEEGVQIYTDNKVQQAVNRVAPNRSQRRKAKKHRKEHR